MGTSELSFLNKKEVCPQFDLSGQVLTVSLYYWSHQIHTIKDLEISISTYAEYPICAKAVLIKPASHLSPNLRTAQIFPDLKFTNRA
jgi:hypothetical protein